jgi:hypothetical protein
MIITVDAVMGRQCCEFLASLCEPSGMHREGEKGPVFGGVFQLCFQCAGFGDLLGNFVWP